MSKNAKERNRDDRSNQIQLELLKKDGQCILDALNKGHMVAVLSKMEVMYVFLFDNAYQCFIHAFDAEEGRRKSFPVSERTTAMMKNLDAPADQLFEITPRADMHPVGVMVAAEKGILGYLDATGQMPAEDMDFMEWMEHSDEDEEG